MASTNPPRQDSDEEHELRTSHRKQCPGCGGNETERLDMEKPRGINSGTTIVETRTCNRCYAGYKLTYVLEDVEVHHEPEVNPDA